MTTDQPENYEHTIYVFGGSTVFCSGAPDTHTLPSHLQRLLLEDGITQYRVVNMGVKGYLVEHQVALLKSVDLHPGDLVIFFDGFNDVTRNFANDFFSTNVNSVDGLQKQIFRFLNGLSERSALYAYFLAPYNFEPSIMDDQPEINRRNATMSEQVFSEIQAAHDYSVESGAEFIHFLQPTLFTISDPSLNEAALIQTYSILPKGFPEIVEQAYQGLEENEPLYAQEGITSFDITSAFDAEHRLSDHDIFYDAVHVDAEGNQILVQVIYAYLEPYLQGD